MDAKIKLSCDNSPPYFSASLMLGHSLRRWPNIKSPYEYGLEMANEY